MGWKEGLIIKLNMIEVAGRTYNWIRCFLFESFIHVRVGKALSGRSMLEKGTPQGRSLVQYFFPL